VSEAFLMFIVETFMGIIDSVAGQSLVCLPAAKYFMVGCCPSDEKKELLQE
jgi:hypothetical protein